MDFLSKAIKPDQTKGQEVSKELSKDEQEKGTVKSTDTAPKKEDKQEKSFMSDLEKQMKDIKDKIGIFYLLIKLLFIALLCKIIN